MGSSRGGCAPYVCYLGDDDLMLPNHVEAAVERLRGGSTSHTLCPRSSSETGGSGSISPTLPTALVSMAFAARSQRHLIDRRRSPSQCLPGLVGRSARAAARTWLTTTCGSGGPGAVIALRYGGSGHCLKFYAEAQGHVRRGAASGADGLFEQEHAAGLREYLAANSGNRFAI